MSEVEFECSYCEESQWIEVEGMDVFDEFKTRCSICETYHIEMKLKKKLLGGEDEN